jgi:DNA-directed RNA polymerase specialized sigma24 family protein
MMTSNEPKKKWLDNEELLKEVIKSKELNQITDELGKLLIKIVDRRLNMAGFRGFSNKDEMAAEALNQLCKTGLSFDPSKSKNPFAYFMSIINGALIAYIARENRQRYIKEDLNTLQKCDNDDGIVL